MNKVMAIQFFFKTNCCGPVKDPEERHELGIT